MKVDGKHTRTIWVEADQSVGTIDQTMLPHRYATLRLERSKTRRVRSSPCRCAARR